MTQEIAKFDHNELDVQMSDFLKQKEANMVEILKDASQRLGKELKEAQDELANNGYGCFEEWYKSLGYKKQSVYNYINAYLFVQQLDNQEDVKQFQDLPKKVQYEIAKPFAESTPEKAQARQEAMKGEYSTFKQYKDRVAELEDRATKAEQREAAEHKERERLEPRQPEVRTEYVETIPDDYEELKQKAKDYDLMQHDRSLDYPYGVELGLKLYEAIEKLSEWQKEHAWIADDIEELRTAARIDKDLRRKFERVDKYWNTLRSLFYGEGVINAEVTEIK